MDLRLSRFFERDKAPAPNPGETPVSSGGARRSSPTRIVLADLLRLRSEAERIRLSTGLRTGNNPVGPHRAMPRGRGIDFEETRRYQPGDDIRTMDWRVTARTGDPHTKIYREERERPVLFCVDVGPSMAFGTKRVFKTVLGAELTALLTWTAVAASDRIGAVVFSADQHRELRPSGRLAGALQVFHAFERLQATLPSGSDTGQIDGALSRLSTVARAGSLVYVISDFRGLTGSGERELIRLGQRVDLALILTCDPIERALPEPDAFPFTDGRQTIVVHGRDPDVRRAYANRFDQHQRRLRHVAARARARFLTVATDESPGNALAFEIARLSARR